MFWDAYIAIIYGILYLCFVAYPIVFTGIRGWSVGLSGLAFTGLAVGCFIVIGSEPLLRKMVSILRFDHYFVETVFSDAKHTGGLIYPCYRYALT